MTTANKKSARDIAVTVISLIIVGAAGVFTTQQVQGTRITHNENAITEIKSASTARDIKIDKLIEDVGWIRGYLETHR